MSDIDKDAADIEEFMEAAKGAKKPDHDDYDGYQDPPVQKSLDEDAIKTGKLVQYSEFGPGFLPTTKTVATLPPGIYTLLVTNAGTIFNPHKVFTDDLLRLPDSRSDEVIAEIEKFWTLKEKFKSFGFSHKRGLLLWGPPGSGKTSTVAFIMKQMVGAGGIVLLANTNPLVTSGALSNLRQIEPERPLVVIMEDLDTIISNYGESEVLSLLDGESSVDNVVFLATTNYPENFDGRVTNRPSRFDRIVKIDVPNDAARKIYLESRGIGKNGESLDKWVESTKGFSIAHIKEAIVSVCCYGLSFEATIKRLQDMGKKKPKSDDLKKMGFGSDE